MSRALSSWLCPVLIFDFSWSQLSVILYSPNFWNKLDTTENLLVKYKFRHDSVSVIFYLFILLINKARIVRITIEYLFMGARKHS